jgi:hypothetical protein
MDTPSPPPQPAPPALPIPPRPLGWTFVITLLAPFLPILLCVLTGVAGGRAAKDSAVPWVFLLLALPVMLGCSIACSIQVGTRKGVGLGILTFIGTQILYVGAAFAGCIASFEPGNFR